MNHEYVEERIDYDEILSAEIRKIPAIFRWTRTVQIITICVLVGINLFSVLLTSLYGIAVGGVFGQAVVLTVVVVVVVQVIWYSFLYKMYEAGNTTFLWIVFGIGFVANLFVLKNFFTAAVVAWIGISIYLTNKARHRADDRYRDLKDAQNEYFRRNERKAAAAGGVSSDDNLIENNDVSSNIWGSTVQKKEVTDEIDEFGDETVDLSRVFARPKSEIEADRFKPDYLKNASQSEQPAFATPASIAGDASDEIKLSNPNLEIGKGGVVYCKRCTFSLLPGEKSCPRCDV